MTVNTIANVRKFEISEFMVKCSCEAHSTNVDVSLMNEEKRENFKSFITDNQTSRFGDTYAKLTMFEKSEIITKIHKAVDEFFQTKGNQTGIYQP